MSNARGMPGGGMWKLRFDRYIIRRVQDEETDTGDLSSDEESDLDQQLYDMDEDRR